MDLVFLRPLLPDDLETIHQWHNSEELYRSLVGSFRRVPMERVREWLDSKMMPSTTELNLAICRSSDSRHIGNVYLRDIDAQCGSAEIHIFIGEPEDRGQGFGAASIRLILARARDELGLRSVHLHVLAENTRAVDFYLRLGFALEATLKAHTCKNGVRKDVLRMSIDLQSQVMPSAGTKRGDRPARNRENPSDSP